MWWCVAPNPSFLRGPQPATSYRLTVDRPPPRTDHLLPHSLHLAQAMVTWAFTRDRVQFFLEDYAYGAKGRVFNIGENTGVLKLLLANNAVQVVSPTAVKKFATGKGNATKDQMVAQFLRETRIDFMRDLYGNKGSLRSPVPDLVDAYYLARWGQTQGEKKL
jgi:hypothetical protein